MIVCEREIKIESEEGREREREGERVYVCLTESYVRIHKCKYINIYK